MKKEFEIYRSNFYGIICMIASILSFIIGFIFILARIEWSGFLATVFFILFVGFMLLFALMFLRPFVVATVNKDKITIYDKETTEIAVNDIKKIELKSNLMALRVNIYTEEKVYNYEWYVSRTIEVKVVLQDFFENLDKEVIVDENNVK